MVLYDYNPELTASTTSPTVNGRTSIQLTDIVGERTITVSAAALVAGSALSVTQTLRFGNGPLSRLTAPDGTKRNWRDSYQYCNGYAPSGADDPSNWTAADRDVDHGGGKMPDIVELQAVSSVDTRIYGYTNTNAAAHGAWSAAGWPHRYYWSGVADGTDHARDVLLGGGYDSWDLVGRSLDITVCRR
jgi:hypothetical protein